MVNGAGCVTDEHVSLIGRSCAPTSVLHLALLWGKPQQTGADILSFGWHLGLRARSLDDVERLLWELCNGVSSHRNGRTRRGLRPVSCSFGARRWGSRC